MAVCDKTFKIYTDDAGPYAGQVLPVPPREEVPLADAADFDCTRDAVRDARETKGLDYDANQAPCC